MDTIKRLLLFVILFGVCNFVFSQSYKAGVISDIHYLSEKLTDKGSSTQEYIKATGRNIIDISMIVDSVINEYISQNINILFIAGDLTKDGERQSHIDLAEKLKKLTENGIKVFVVPGNHDINVPQSVSYREDKTFQTENISPDDFKNIYSHCGYSSAIKHDSTTLSYVASISPNIWLLAIDSNLYREYKNHSVSAGQILPSTERWILQVLSEAKEQNIKVIAMMHHGLVEHIIYQDLLLPQYLVNDWQRLASLFADNGIKVIFTGHAHANDISEFVSSNDNKIYDVETGALCSYPFPYRYVDILDEGINISTKNINSINTNLQLKEEGKILLKNAALNMVRPKIKDKFKDLPASVIDSIAELISEIFILHARGDEAINNTLKKKIEYIANEMEIPVDTSPEYFQLDYPPSDNKLTISF